MPCHRNPILLLVPAALLLPAAAPAPPPAEAVAADDAFAQLSRLAGVWRPADNPQSPLRIRFYLTAGGTVLVESWEAGGRPHSLDYGDSWITGLR